MKKLARFGMSGGTGAYYKAKNNYQDINYFLVMIIIFNLVGPVWPVRIDWELSRAREKSGLE